MKLRRNLGMVLLAVWLIATGALPLLQITFAQERPGDGFARDCGRNPAVAGAVAIGDLTTQTSDCQPVAWRSQSRLMARGSPPLCPRPILL
jgi:hypothetical protein